MESLIGQGEVDRASGQDDGGDEGRDPPLQRVVRPRHRASDPVRQNVPASEIAQSFHERWPKLGHGHRRSGTDFCVELRDRGKCAVMRDGVSTPFASPGPLVGGRAGTPSTLLPAAMKVEGGSPPRPQIE